MRVLAYLPLVFLLGCSSNVYEAPPGIGPSSLIIENPNPVAHGQGDILVNLRPVLTGAVVERMTVEFSFAHSRNRSIPRLPLPESDRVRLAQELTKEARADKSVMQEYGVAVARNTYCRTGSIGLNRKGRSYTSASDIQAIINANGGVQIGERIPAGLSGKQIPPVEYQSLTSLNAWNVRLTCDAPTPY